jgi:hypothetical protein
MASLAFEEGMALMRKIITLADGLSKTGQSFAEERHPRTFGKQNG